MHDKTYNKTQIILGVCPVWSVLTFRMKKASVLSYPLSIQQRLIRLGRCPGWFESSLGANAILLVLSIAGSYHIYPKYSDRQVYAQSVDPEKLQKAASDLGSTLCAIHPQKGRNIYQNLKGIFLSNTWWWIKSTAKETKLHRFFFISWFLAHLISTKWWFCITLVPCWNRNISVSGLSVLFALDKSC